MQSQIWIRHKLRKTAGVRPLILSAVSGAGVQEALRAIAAEIAARKKPNTNVIPAEKEEAWRS